MPLFFAPVVLLFPCPSSSQTWETMAKIYSEKFIKELDNNLSAML
jgi:hypothetical protein